MNLSNKTVSDLIGKDKIKAQKAAEQIVNGADTAAWACLVENAEFLFDYIKVRAVQNLLNAVNNTNYRNLLSFMDVHSQDFDRLVAEGLARFSSEALNQEILAILKEGSESQKAYAAKYFAVSIYPPSEEVLFNSSKDESLSIKSNSAEALGKMASQKAYDYYIDLLRSEDDWYKLDAARFLSSYGKKEAVVPMLYAMSDSAMAEHLAGEAAALSNLVDVFQAGNDEIKILVLEALDNIFSGMPEVWPISSIMSFRIYESLVKLIDFSMEEPDSAVSAKIAQVLLRARQKVSTFFGTDEYTYDQEKLVLGELEEIYHLLQSQGSDYWNSQASILVEELYEDDDNRVLAALSVIEENKMQEALGDILKRLTEYDNNDMVKYQTILTLVELNAIDKVDNISQYIDGIQDVNMLVHLKSLVKTKL